MFVGFRHRPNAFGHCRWDEVRRDVTVLRRLRFAGLTGKAIRPYKRRTKVELARTVAETTTVQCEQINVSMVTEACDHLMRRHALDRSTREETAG